MRKIKIHLHGKLKELCGNNDVVEIGASNTRMAFRGLYCLYGTEVKKHVLNNKWHVYTDEEHNNDIGPFQVHDKLETDEIHIYPYIGGSGGKTGRVILGVVLVVAGVWLASYDGGSSMKAGINMIGGAMISMGTGMILQAFFTPDQANMRERPDERASFLFSGAVNTSEQGQPVNLVFGRTRTGAAVVSAGLDVEELMNYWIDPYGDGGGGGSPNPDDPALPNELVYN